MTFLKPATVQPIAQTGLAGPYRLAYEAIDAVVRRAPGVFALGHPDASGRFCVNHIGRADSDLKGRLLECIGSDLLFKFGYFPTSRAAFERECELFHDIAPPRNRVHPGRPSGTTWECPRCRLFARHA